MAIRYPLVLNGTTIEELQSADSIDFTSASISGDLTFTGTGARVKANFSDPIATNRLLFQTSTANSTTLVGIMPNGTGTTSGIYGVNSSTLTNASYFDLRVSGSGNDVRLTSDYYGAGTYLPITFYTGGSERVRIDTSGNFNIAGLTASRALATDASKNLVSSTVTSTELGYLSGVTSAIQTQINSKVTNSFTASRALVSDGSGLVSVSTVTSTELGYLSGVTSAIQTQLNSKAGTATANTFTNNQIISVNSSSDALRITQTGSGNALVVEDSANPDSTPFVVEASGDVLIGTSTSIPGAFSDTGKLQIAQNTGEAVQQAYTFTANANGSYLYLNKSRSPTVGANTLVQSGDVLGGLVFAGADGTTYHRAASIDVSVDGTPGTNDMPGRLVFSTTADGASSPTERMRIDNAGRIGFGATPNSDVSFIVGKNLTGATASYQQINSTTVQSDVTVSASMFATYAQTQAASFTLGQLIHYLTGQGPIGATSTVTNQYGFLANSSLTGATNNYGFYSNIASGSGRYNFYAAGTADNYFGGPVVVSASSSSDALRITQTGAGSALVVEDSANPDSTPFVVLGNGHVVSGYTTQPFFISGVVPSMASIGTSNTDGGFASVRYSNDVSPTFVHLAKSRGAIGAQGIVSSGDTIGNLTFSASDGTIFTPAASIVAQVDGTPGTNDMPGRLVFNTTSDGASSPIEAFRVSSSQNVLFGRTYAGSERIGIGGATSSISTVTSANGIYNDTTISSAQTNIYTANGTYLSTQAAAFTLANLRHHAAAQFTIGAGSTVTNQMGFMAENSLTGATVNYGFYGNIASGSGRYNFYAAGTADNYFAGSVGIGSTPSVNTTIQITKALTGGTAAYGVLLQPTIQSDVIGNAFGFITAISTQAASFTINSVRHFQVQQGSIGAGSAVTSQFGFLADSSLTGATNNYGFYSNIASGSGRYNFYAAGTADNYFGGAIGIGDTALTGYTIKISRSITGATNAVGMQTLSTIQSDVTSSVLIFGSKPSTAAAAFTLGTLYHFIAEQGTVGAGSAVTNQMGFSVQSSLTGATNNYGFHSNIASGSGRYNFYAAGTADNYFAGSVAIGSTASNASFYNARLITGAVNAYGNRLVATGDSTVTNTLYGYGSALATSATAYTLATATHFAALGTSVGAGSTITNQYGFFVDSSLTGATNNFGFYSNIASGSNRYNFYAAGTADNYFAGNVKTEGTLAGGYSALSAGTTAMGLASDKVVKVTPNATATFTTTVAPAGATASIIIVTSGTTSYTITFGTGFLTTGTLATGTVTAKTFVVNFVSDGTTMIETSRTVAM